ncbi:MAG: hypothetical protein SGJ13_11795 [Actinomycetota bacterium]|nr:hypothetical protein [Actinomycetota bacterium]
MTEPADTTPPPEETAPNSALVLAFFTVVGVIFAFPLSPAKWTTHIPGNQGDALLNLWILRWGGTHFDDGWGSLWDTTIFSPRANTLAYSESMLPVALVHRVLAFVFQSDVLAFNVIYVATWALSGWITYLLARRLTGNTTASVLAGLAFTLTTTHLIHYSFFQLGFSFLIPLIVLLALNLFESKRVVTGALLGAATAVLALSSSYYGLVIGLVLALLIPTLLLWHRDSFRQLLPALGAAAIVGGVLVAPVAYQYRELQQDTFFHRDPEIAARVDDFLRVSPDNYVLADLPPWDSRSTPESATIEQRLFPGIVVTALTLFGLFALWQQRRSRSAKSMLALVPPALLLVVLSFGEYIGYGTSRYKVPWARVWNLPGFTGIRVPARFIVFPMLLLALVAAFGLAWLLTHMRSRALRVALVVALGGVLATESAIEIQFSRVPNDAASEAVNEALRDLPRGAVAELPMVATHFGGAWAYTEMPRQYLSLIDGNERLGGYSGYAPAGYNELARVLETFPGERALSELEQLGARYVILRLSLPSGVAPLDRESIEDQGVGPFSEDKAEAIIDALPPDRVRNLGRFGDAYLLELVSSAGA